MLRTSKLAWNLTWICHSNPGFRLYSACFYSALVQTTIMNGSILLCRITYILFRLIVVEAYSFSQYKSPDHCPAMLSYFENINIEKILINYRKYRVYKRIGNIWLNVKEYRNHAVKMIKTLSKISYNSGSFFKKAIVLSDSILLYKIALIDIIWALITQFRHCSSESSWKRPLPICVFESSIDFYKGCTTTLNQKEFAIACLAVYNSCKICDLIGKQVYHQSLI